MKKYLVVPMDDFIKKDEFESFLNEKGEDEWNVVCYTPFGLILESELTYKEFYERLGFYEIPERNTDEQTGKH